MSAEAVYQATCSNRLDDVEFEKLSCIGDELEKMGDSVLSVIGRLLTAERIAKGGARCA